MIICFPLERFPLPLDAWDGLRYFIVALPEPSINYFVDFARYNQTICLRGKKDN